MTSYLTANPAGRERTPGKKLLFSMLISMLLAVPLLSVYLLVYDRNQQSTEARASIVEGWGGQQTIAGPILAIPYDHAETTEVEENGKKVEKTQIVTSEFLLSPDVIKLDTAVMPQRRHRSIYDAIVYEVAAQGDAKFTLPHDLARQGYQMAGLHFDRAELRFGLSDPRGLFGTPPHIRVDGQAVALSPGHGPASTGGGGFYAGIDATSLRTSALSAHFDFNFRGNAALALKPQAGDTDWAIHSSWQSPRFKGSFLPTTHHEGAGGFTAEYRIGNLALGQALVGQGDTASSEGQAARAEVNLIQPVDVYDQVNRATKYGFLFIGFTFLMFLMFDLIGGVKVSPVEYLLVGAALILFFVMLLAFAEVVGFLIAYLGASGAIIALITAYSSAVLKSRQRAGLVGGLLVGLYAVLYVLLSLEAFSLLIGAVLLFFALAGVMFATRRIDWSAAPAADAISA